MSEGSFVNINGNIQYDYSSIEMSLFKGVSDWNDDLIGSNLMTTITWYTHNKEIFKVFMYILKDFSSKKVCK